MPCIYFPDVPEYRSFVEALDKRPEVSARRAAGNEAEE